MKFGEQFEEASVPGWSLHNVDYNSLKHQIKTHTTKDQAAVAIAIPGHQDQQLRRFEDGFYSELRSQHDRVGLFVTSKADEISRRLRHISTLVHQLSLKCVDTQGLSAKRQRRFSKYYGHLEECGRDIKALSRFADAQVTAFRKILKKYKKWTGSTTLTTRFKETVLSHPKSFTNFMPGPLQAEYHQIRTTLEANSLAHTNFLEPSSPAESYDVPSRRDRRDSYRAAQSAAAIAHSGYWNEYDHGSEAGDNEDTYVIYIDPNANDDFPGFTYMKNMFGNPVDSVRHWLQSQKTRDASSMAPVSSPSETQSLLGRRQDSTVSDYFTTRHSASDEPVTEDDNLSSHSSSSADDYKLGLYQDRMLTRAVIVAFIAAFVLLGISALLVMTGRRRLRLEVDAGAAVGSVASLFCACMGLGAMLYRHYPGSPLYCLAVWVTFITVCILNGILLVLIAGRSGI
ncbi:hypothetical protein NPX13_g4055 [Xylaria arbuscula]|uniref:SPX domain-containing protein n=1 Tax=Xylaria arbuscula TaxID=114810 RepID=A0A9W8NHA1_9PEZI|nr:hypothetical protein NPX13_g4055 [Xylaria arbuscula]